MQGGARMTPSPSPRRADPGGRAVAWQLPQRLDRGHGLHARLGQPGVLNNAPSSRIWGGIRTQANNNA